MTRRIFIFALLIALLAGLAPVADGAVAWRSKTFNSGTGTSFTATEPSGAAQNDILLMWIVVAGTNTSFVGPSGWTQLHALPATSADVWLYWIRRGAGAPSFAVSWTTSSFFEWGVHAVSGAETSGSPFDADVANARTTGTDPNPPSVTTTVSNDLIMIFGMNWQGVNSGTWGAPTNYTIREPNTTGGDIMVGSRAGVGVGAEDPGAFTGTTSSNEIAEITVAIKEPQSAATPKQLLTLGVGI